MAKIDLESEGFNDDPMCDNERGTNVAKKPMGAARPHSLLSDSSNYVHLCEGTMIVKKLQTKQNCKGNKYTVCTLMV